MRPLLRNSLYKKLIVLGLSLLVEALVRCSLGRVGQNAAPDSTELRVLKLLVGFTSVIQSVELDESVVKVLEHRSKRE